jgi:hypothetical protein
VSRRVVILRGIPGSGKTMLAHRYARKHRDTVVCSADDLFYDETDVYAFDPARIGEAHGECFLSVLAALRHGTERIVVDNTNTTAVEIAPYVLAAQAYGYDHEVWTIPCDVDVAITRGVHGVPADRVRAMAAALDAEQMPPWWNRFRHEEEVPASRELTLASMIEMTNEAYAEAAK